MSNSKIRFLMSRRQFGKSAMAVSGTMMAAATPLRYALGDNPLKIGLILPYSGVYANFGAGITAGFEYALKKRDNQLGGRPVVVIKGDDQLDPKIGSEVTTKLVTRDKVDIVCGTVGSNVVPVMEKICVDNNTFLIVPTAASNGLTREHCNPLVFRVSHSNWQMTSPAGAWLYKRGKRRAMTMGMNYGAGQEEVGAFAEEFKKAGGEVIDQKWPGLQGARLSGLFRRRGREEAGHDVHLLRRFQRRRVRQAVCPGRTEGRVPLYGAAYLTDSTLLHAEGKAADGVITSGHWAPSLDNPTNKAFIADFKKTTGKEADLNSMHGHDSIEVWPRGLEKTKGDVKDRKALSAALQKVEFAKSARAVPFLERAQSDPEHLRHPGAGRRPQGSGGDAEGRDRSDRRVPRLSRGAIALPRRCSKPRRGGRASAKEPVASPRCDVRWT